MPIPEVDGGVGVGGASSTGVSGRDVVVRLVERLQPLIGRELSAPTDRDEDGFIQWWRDVLTEAQTAIEGRLVIVVDALDVLADDRARSDVAGEGHSAVDRVVVFDDEPPTRLQP